MRQARGCRKTRAQPSLALEKEAPLEVTPVVAQNLVALMLKGPKVTRIAVADTARGTWLSQELRGPFEGQAVPLVAPGVVVYNFGREVYAYGADAQSWDVAELAEGVRAFPFVGAGTATIDSHGHIYTFAADTGRWDHVDVRAILDVAGTEK